ncbi:hypothetical protein [Actinosynnema mirum]|uniref:oxidoreductase n=1 Tax=Actinosynnema mirum TaxID=40567 RepID=UPI001FDF3186|nr:hypothetical protein [Actinosynnema mirum]
MVTPGLHTDEQVAGWRRVTGEVRDRGKRVFAQLWHVGPASHVSLQPDGAPGRVPASAPRALRTDADAAGFRGVELHAATQHLFEQFLNSRVNDRPDRHGGRTPANRLRFALEVVDAVVERLGAHRVGVRVSPFGAVGAMPAGDRAEETYRALSAELSALRPEPTRTALVLAGGLTFTTAAALVAEGLIGLAAFGRPHIANPDLVQRLRAGLPLAEADPATFFGGDAAGHADCPAVTGAARRPA